MNIKNWSIEQETGYKPITTFYQDFSIADRFNIDAVKDTYNRAFKEWQDNYKYITELVMVLNWKIWEHHNSNNIELSKVYNDLWVKLDKWVQDNFNADELDYYYTTTD